MKPSKKLSLREMFEQASAIINFMIEKNCGNDALLQFLSIIEETYLLNNLSGMRHLHKDVYEWAAGLPKTQIIELNTLLKNMFGTEIQRIL